MIAAELIDLLKRHPKACERLGITIGRRLRVRWAMTDEGDLGAFEDSDQMLASRLRLWVLGAASEWCDEHGIEALRNVTQRGTTDYVIYRDLVVDDKPYPSRLHACLAAIEATT